MDVTFAGLSPATESVRLMRVRGGGGAAEDRHLLQVTARRQGDGAAGGAGECATQSFSVEHVARVHVDAKRALLRVWDHCGAPLAGGQQTEEGDSGEGRERRHAGVLVCQAQLEDPADAELLQSALQAVREMCAFRLRKNMLARDYMYMPTRHTVNMEAMLCEERGRRLVQGNFLVPTEHEHEQEREQEEQLEAQESAELRALKLAHPRRVACKTTRAYAATTASSTASAATPSSLPPEIAAMAAVHEKLVGKPPPPSPAADASTGALEDKNGATGPSAGSRKRRRPQAAGTTARQQTVIEQRAQEQFRRQQPVITDEALNIQEHALERHARRVASVPGRSSVPVRERVCALCGAMALAEERMQSMLIHPTVPFNMSGQRVYVCLPCFVFWQNKRAAAARGNYLKVHPAQSNEEICSVCSEMPPELILCCACPQSFCRSCLQVILTPAQMSHMENDDAWRCPAHAHGPLPPEPLVASLCAASGGTIGTGSTSSSHGGEERRIMSVAEVVANDVAEIAAHRVWRKQTKRAKLAQTQCEEQALERMRHQQLLLLQPKLTHESRMPKSGKAALALQAAARSAVATVTHQAGGKAGAGGAAPFVQHMVSLNRARNGGFSPGSAPGGAGGGNPPSIASRMKRPGNIPGSAAGRTLSGSSGGAGSGGGGGGGGGGGKAKLKPAVAAAASGAAGSTAARAPSAKVSGGTGSVAGVAGGSDAGRGSHSVTGARRKVAASAVPDNGLLFEDNEYLQPNTGRLRDDGNLSARQRGLLELQERKQQQALEQRYRQHQAMLDKRQKSRERSQSSSAAAAAAAAATSHADCSATGSGSGSDSDLDAAQLFHPRKTVAPSHRRQQSAHVVSGASPASAGGTARKRKAKAASAAVVATFRRGSCPADSAAAATTAAMAPTSALSATAAAELPPVDANKDDVFWMAYYCRYVWLQALHSDDTEEDCFLCKDGGNLAECDSHRGNSTCHCLKVYHEYCLGFSLPEDEDATWICPRHYCTDCGGHANVSCIYCPASWCLDHSGNDLLLAAKEYARNFNVRPERVPTQYAGSLNQQRERDQPRGAAALMLRDAVLKRLPRMASHQSTPIICPNCQRLVTRAVQRGLLHPDMLFAEGHYATGPRKKRTFAEAAAAAEKAVKNAVAHPVLARTLPAPPIDPSQPYGHAAHNQGGIIMTTADEATPAPAPAPPVPPAHPAVGHFYNGVNSNGA